MTRKRAACFFMPERVIELGKTDVILEIDTTEAQKMLDQLRKVYTKEHMQKLLYRVYKRTGTHVKTILGKDVPKEYRIKSKKVKEAVAQADTIMSNDGHVTSTIPVVSERHSIGGKTFRAKCGRHGFKGIVAGKRYKITANIVRERESVLPTEIKGTIGKNGKENAPFRNLSAKKLNGVAFVRETPKRLPIKRIVGIATPQPPKNRSEDEVTKDIQDMLTKRIAHEHDQMMLQIMTGKIK